MWTRTELSKALSLKYPIIQAGMAGGHTTPELVAAVSEVGGLGTIGAGYMKPEDLQKSIHLVKSITERPFAVNLFIPEAVDVSEKRIHETKKLLTPIAQKFETEIPEPQIDHTLFQEQFKVLIEEEVKVFSFTFGVPDDAVVKICKEKNIYMIGTATTVDEGLALEDAGVDAVTAQGYEAGGHQGKFNGNQGAAEGIGTIALVSQMVSALSIPVIAAGGMMNGKGILAGLSLGASAAQMGTAFLTAKESGTPDVHKQAIFDADETESKLTKSFSGKWARGIENEMMRQVDPFSEQLAPYPITNQMTQPIRKKAKETGDKEYMSLWAGQGVRLAQANYAAQLIQQWVREADEQLKQLNE